MTSDSGTGLAATFAQIARDLQAQGSPEGIQETVTKTAVATVASCDHAAISVVRRRGGVQTVAPTDDVPSRVDALQYETGEGPCLDAIRVHQTYVIDDLARDDRWPRFSRRAAAETGVRSMMSFRLFVQGDTIGALNFYARRPAAFESHAQVLGTVLGAHAALAVTAAREHQRAQQLDEALESSRRIGVAVGILMVRHRLTADDAFARLRRASRYLNLKLRDVAEHVTETGALPDRRDAPR